jgi:hypothetical protein
MKIFKIYLLIAVIFSLQIYLIQAWTNDYENNLGQNFMNTYFNMKKNELFNQKLNKRPNKNLHKKPVSNLNKSSAVPIPSFNYIGCFSDKRELRDLGDKDFTFITKYNKSMPTVELCVLLCSQDGFSFAGVQAFDECYCGYSYGRYNETDSRNCFFNCGGKYTCGGYNANSVYYISLKKKDALSEKLDKKPNGELDRSLVSSSSSSAIDQNQNPCLASPCKNSGICVTLMDDRGTPRGFICKCINPQDSGMYCEERNFCYSNPCLNNGHCVNMPTAYKCECASNYNGKNCEVYDVCGTKPCLNDGECIMKSPTFFECNCTKNYIGATCELLNPCHNVTCMSRGVCRYTSGNDFFCLCESNFVGKNCDQCKPQFTGLNCDQCIPGFTGKNCDQLVNQCTPNPCLNGFCLKDSTRLHDYKCVCADGWTGKKCSEKNCLIDPCLNGGHCALSFNNQTDQVDYKCNCPANLYGRQCEFSGK